MRTAPRRRRYVAPSRLTMCRPLLEYDDSRDAYILRAVGHRIGPVLRKDRRHERAASYLGPERRGATCPPARSRDGWALPS